MQKSLEAVIPGMRLSPFKANAARRKMDMLNADLLLKNEADSKMKGKKTQREEDESTAGFHFIAFMPIGKSLWKFDGLERQPMSLGEIPVHTTLHAPKLISSVQGPITGDWLAQATPDIQARMAQYEESQIEFAILSLVKDPIIDLLSALAKNVKGLIAAHSRLDTIQPDWKSFTTSESLEDDRQATAHVLTGPDAGLGLTKEQISQARITEQLANRLRTGSSTEAMTLRKELIAAQQGLRMAIQEETQSKYLEEERASARTRDFGAKMQKFARKVKTKEVS